jgi:hypothetical protein
VANLYEEIALYDKADIKSVQKEEWGAGASSKYELFKIAFPTMTEDINWDDGDYSGVWAMAFKLDNLYYIVNDYYGSCSGCDSLESDENGGLDYLKEVCSNARGFTSWDKMRQYLESTESQSWTNDAGKAMLKLVEEKISKEKKEAIRKKEDAIEIDSPINVVIIEK